MTPYPYRIHTDIDQKRITLTRHADHAELQVSLEEWHVTTMNTGLETMAAAELLFDWHRNEIRRAA